jgi:hypothetical protein
MRKHALEKINPGTRSFSDIELKEEDQKQKTKESPRRSPRKAA